MKEKIMRNFIICTVHQILLEWPDGGVGDTRTKCNTKKKYLWVYVLTMKLKKLELDI
jgi:hypothetical protein